MERTIAERWQVKWRTVRARAAPIVTGNTPSDLDEEGYVGEVETIELIVDDDDGYNSDLNYE